MDDEIYKIYNAFSKFKNLIDLEFDSLVRYFRNFGLNRESDVEKMVYEMKSIGKCSKLEVLSIKLHPNAPGRVLDYLSELPDLKKLYVYSANNVKDFPVKKSSSFLNLKCLYLEEAKFKRKACRSILKLKNLEYFFIFFLLSLH